MFDKIWYLEKINLISKITEKDKKYLNNIVEIEKIENSRIIFSVGDKANNIFIIKSGKVKISKILEDGKQITLSILKQGDILGEACIIGQDYQDTIAETIEETCLCIINKRDFENLLLIKPELNLKITKLIGWRLKNIENRIENLIFRDVTSRIIYTLLELSKSYTKITNDGIEINMKLTHEELGSLIAVNRQTVTTKLNELKQLGLIDLKRSKIILKDSNKLENLLLSNN